MDFDGSTPLSRMETARPVVRLDVRRLDRAMLPPEAEEIRLELSSRGRKLGKVDLQRLPGVAWGEFWSVGSAKKRYRNCCHDTSGAMLGATGGCWLG